MYFIQEREMGDIVADWKEKYETAEQNFKNQKVIVVLLINDLDHFDDLLHRRKHW